MKVARVDLQLDAADIVATMKSKRVSSWSVGDTYGRDKKNKSNNGHRRAKDQ